MSTPRNWASSDLACAVAWCHAEDCDAWGYNIVPAVRDLEGTTISGVLPRPLRVNIYTNLLLFSSLRLAHRGQLRGLELRRLHRARVSAPVIVLPRACQPWRACGPRVSAIWRRRFKIDRERTSSSVRRPSRRMDAISAKAARRRSIGRVVRLGAIGRADRAVHTFKLLWLELWQHSALDTVGHYSPSLSERDAQRASAN